MSWYERYAEALKKIYGQAFEVETLEDIRECAFRGTTIEVVDSEGKKHTRHADFESRALDCEHLHLCSSPANSSS